MIRTFNCVLQESILSSAHHKLNAQYCNNCTTPEKASRRHTAPFWVIVPTLEGFGKSGDIGTFFYTIEPNVPKEHVPAQVFYTVEPNVPKECSFPQSNSEGSYGTT